MFYEKTILLRNKISRFFYKKIFRKFFFKIDPEKIHNYMIEIGEFLGKYKTTRFFTAVFFSYSNNKLEQNILGINFKNPMGLAAGFDKDARIINIMESTGFGHTEIGSVTGEFCKGNEKPRLWRLKRSQALVINYGLKNQGAEKIADRLDKLTCDIPLGISIAKTNSKKTINLQKGIEDYLKAYKSLKQYADYLTINISCPNTFGGEPFTDPKKLDLLLTEIDKIEANSPIFLKMPLDLKEKELDPILEVVSRHNISGFICSNLSKDRNNKSVMSKIKEKEIPQKGSVSGIPIKNASTEVINEIYKKTKGKYIIIGCGGIFSAKDAYEKIKAGASLLQMITGMIYEGPQLISEINQGLVELLKKDGFTNISEAIGMDHK